MTETPKNCPMCTGKAKTYFVDDGCFVYCIDCSHEGEFVKDRNCDYKGQCESEAIKSWNIKCEPYEDLKNFKFDVSKYGVSRLLTKEEENRKKELASLNKKVKNQREQLDSLNKLYTQQNEHIEKLLLALYSTHGIINKENTPRIYNIVENIIKEVEENSGSSDTGITFDYLKVVQEKSKREQSSLTEASKMYSEKKDKD